MLKKKIVFEGSDISKERVSDILISQIMGDISMIKSRAHKKLATHRIDTGR